MTETRKPLALVTGAGRRIGAAIATDLGAHGFRVALHANRSITDVDMLVAAINERGDDAFAVQADLTDRQLVRMMIDDLIDEHGPVQLLVNNASVFEPDEATAIDHDAWDAHFEVHLRAPSILAEAMVNALPDDAEGLIVNLIDQRVWRLTPRFYSYTLSKSALWTATQTMAQAFAPNVRVNAIGPGPTLANIRQDPADFAAQVDAVPLARGPELSEFGATVRYLWSARSVTGQMIALDGGQHLAWETPDVLNARE